MKQTEWDTGQAIRAGRPVVALILAGLHRDCHLESGPKSKTMSSVQITGY
jgi:hypothetical protein